MARCCISFKLVLWLLVQFKWSKKVLYNERIKLNLKGMSPIEYRAHYYLN